MFALYCDVCSRHYTEENQGYCAWPDKSSVDVDAAEQDGWHIDTYNDKHYCPRCHEIDDNDNLIIHEVGGEITKKP